MGEKMLKINEGNFNTEVLTSKIPVLVDFSAVWCAPCRMFEPALEEAACAYAGKAKVCRIDVDESPDIAGQYNVMSYPTLILFKEGKPAEKTVGLMTKTNLFILLDKHA